MTENESLRAIRPEVFIKEIEKRKPLYSGDPVDSDKKFKLWTEIGEALFKDWSTLSKTTIHERVLMLRRRWKSFRDTYSRELRQRRRGKRVNRQTYKYFNHLKFLGGHEDLPKNDDEEQDYEEHGENGEHGDEDAIYFQFDETDVGGAVFKEEPNYDQEDDEPPQKVRKTNYRKEKAKKKRYTQEYAEEPLGGVEDVPLAVPVYAEDDGDRLFMLSFLSEMKNLPVNIKMWARSQISNVMQEAVMCSLNNSQPGQSRKSYEIRFSDRDTVERKSSSSSE